MTSPQLEKYIQVAWEPDDIIEIRPLPKELGKRVWLKASEVLGYYSELLKDNQQGANIYAGILPRATHGGGKAKDVNGGQVLFVDFDGCTVEEANEACTSLGVLPPTMVVFTGHGVHCFWKLDRWTEKALWQELEHQVVEYFLAQPQTEALIDKSVKDPARILRLPGFTNHKPPVAEAYLVRADHFCMYNPEDIREVFQVQTMDTPLDASSVPKKPALVPSVPAMRPVGGSSLFDRARAYIDKIPGCSKGGRTNTAFRAACAMVNDFGLNDSDALYLLTQWDQSSNLPPIASDYPADELSKIILHAHRYAKKVTGALASAQMAPRVQECSQVDLSSIINGSPSTGQNVLNQGESSLWGNQVKSFSEINMDDFTFVPIVEGLLIERSLNLLYGGPGTLKTMLTLDLIVQGAIGGAWLPRANRFNFPSPVCSLIVENDTGRVSIFQRLSALAKARNAQEPALKKIHTLLFPEPPFNGSNQGHFKELEKVIRKTKAKIIIIDCLAGIFTEVDENSSETGNIVASFKGVAERTDSAILLIHHQSKSGGYRGSSSIKDRVDLSLSLERKKDNVVLITADKERDISVGPFSAKFISEQDEKGNLREAFFEFAGNLGGIEIDSTIQQLENAILSFLKQWTSANKSTITDAMQKAVGASKGKTGKVLKHLEDAGKVEVKRGDKNASVFQLVWQTENSGKQQAELGLEC